MSEETKKPRIINGICEFCGIPAKDCPHYKDELSIDNSKNSKLLRLVKYLKAKLNSLIK